MRIFRGVVQPPPPPQLAAADDDAATAQSGDDREGGADASFFADSSQRRQTSYEGESSQLSKSVSCPELGLMLRFHNVLCSRNGSPEFGADEEVQYAVGIKDKGLYAHGLTRVNCGHVDV